MQEISLAVVNGSGEVCDRTFEMTDIFYSNRKRGIIFHVSISCNGILLKRETLTGDHKDHLINISDIIGGRCVWIQKSSSFRSVSTCGACASSIKEKQNHCSQDAYLYIFAYVLKKNHRDIIRRERTVVSLRFRSFDNHEDNMREAEKWYMALKYHRDNHLLQSNISCNKKIQKPICRKRLLILINPKSGSGKARELFNAHVVTVLNEAEVTYDLYITKHSSYAFNFVRHKDVSVWNGIVAIGGDGLFHEILNGLLKRKDWKNVINTLTLGIVPCGSGNGLARSIAHYFYEPYEPKPILGAALSLVNGVSAPMDVVEIKQQNKITYSFLSIGWGLISDIDIESERFRLLGYQRFTIWTLHRLINLRTYRGRISYLLKSHYEQQNCSVIINQMNMQRSVSSPTFSTSHELKSRKFSNVDNVEFEDVISLETMTNQSHRSRCNSLLSSGSKVSTYYSIAESIYHSVGGNSDCCDTLESEPADDFDESRLEKSIDNSLPSLQDPLPDTWLVEDGEFVMVHAAYQTHLGSDCYFSPRSKLNDGIIFLVIIRRGISRSQLLNFLINMSSGTHLQNISTDFIKVERVVAFRLEPHENNGILTVDGERVESTWLQARIFPECVNVMVPNKLPSKSS